MSKPNRSSIPVSTAARLLFLSDRTCCVCRVRGKPVQIHHLDDNPKNHEPSNLAVLCLDCHRDTQIKGGFDRKLDAAQVVLYRDDWHGLVSRNRVIVEAGEPLPRAQTQVRVWKSLVRWPRFIARPGNWGFWHIITTGSATKSCVISTSSWH